MEGTLRIVLALSSEFKARGYEVKVFCNEISDNVLQKVGDDVYYNSVTKATIATDFKDRLKILLEPVFGLSSRRMLRAIKYYAPDVILVLFVDAVKLASMVRIPCIYLCLEPTKVLHEKGLRKLISELRGFKGKFFNFFAPILSYFEIRSVKRFDEVLTISYYVREIIWWVYGIEAKVAYPGVDVDFFKPDPSTPKENFFLYVGRLSAARGTDILLKSLQHCDTKLVLVGAPAPGAYTPKISELMKKYESNIKVINKLSDKELVDLYRRALAVIYPARMEPYGLVILEAMACGTPVVCFKEGGPRELVINGVTGILVEPNPRSLAEAMSMLMKDRAIAEKMGNEARKFMVNNFKLSEFANKVEESIIKVSQNATSTKTSYSLETQQNPQKS